MSVWVCIPSKRPVEHVVTWAAAWRERGYEVALWRDSPAESKIPVDGLWIFGNTPYPGYAVAVNEMATEILGTRPECNWIVTGGDDVYPDPNHTADEIARQCENHFQYSATFGVMQPTGDRFPSDTDCWADRVCCTPWMGRMWCERINQGRGPLWSEYTHNFVDEELQNVAIKYGVLWQRRDLVQRHENWSRARKDIADMPDFLKGVTGPSREAQAHWRKYKLLFELRKSQGFPGSNPL